ncbi:MAG: 50S ribosomal protein L24 [Patescibacteria group bacterium]|jgi:large subunit ribosomal protein L24
MKIKKNDNVLVKVGKDRGKSGIVDSVFATENKLTVKGVHIMKKHVKPSRKNPQGGIIDINKKLDASNVAVICPNCGKSGRVGYSIKNDAKIRICKKCNQSIEGGAK